MNSNPQSIAESDPTVARVGEVSLRMMAETVGPACLREIQDTLAETPAHYPWERVVELVLREPIEPADLVRRGLVAQRDWVAARGRGGGGAGGAPGPVPVPKSSVRGRGTSVGVRVKTLLAFLLVRGAFQAMIAVALVVILLLLKARWPEIDVYRLLEPLREHLPGLFGPR